LGLKWLYLALNGFVFYRQNRHFTSVKSGDFCIFKMGLFRNFMFCCQPHPVDGRPQGPPGTPRQVDALNFWLLELGRLELSPPARGGSPLF